MPDQEQFDGEGVKSLSIDDRMTVANMAIEAGGKNSIFEFDDQTKAFVDARCQLNGTKADYSTPAQPPEGIVHVLVNGAFAVRDGALTGERSGMALRHRAP